MGILDYSYRIKPAAGHAAPRNEKNTSQTLTGGTITLVDLGGGAYTWEFSGADATGALPAFTANLATGQPATSGITFAVRTRNVVNHTSTGFVPLVGVGPSTNLNNDGTYLGQSGVGTRRGRAGGGLLTTTMGTVGFTEKTFVFRIAANASGADGETLQVWEEGVGAAATPDYPGNNVQILNSLAYSTVVVGASGGATIRVSDLVFWPEALTEAQCRAIATDINAALAAPAVPVITTQPVSQSVTAPATATFSVTATGATSYQWKRNGVAISGAVAASYTTPATSVTGGTANNGDSYTVDVTNASGTVTSSAASLSVSAAGATALTLSGPTGGQVGAASAAFTVGANGAIGGSHTVTLSDGGAGGTFSPASVTISAGTPTATFTYTPGSAGAKSISATDAGGYTAPAPLTYTATATAGTLTVTGIKNGSGSTLTTTLPNVLVVQRSNRAALLALTAQQVTGGTLTINSGALSAGVACIVLAFSDDGASTGAWPATVA